MLLPVSGDAPDLDSGPVLVAAWAAELTRRVSAGGVSPAELDRLLTGAVDTLALAGAAVPLDIERARGVGASLAYAGLVAPDVLPVTIAVLGTHLAAALWAAGAADPAAVTPRIVAAVADGYVRTLRSRVHEVAAPYPADTEVSPALRTSEARFQAVFAHAGTGIILGDPYGRILDVNASFAEMLGYSIEEIRGRDIRDFIHPDEVPRMMDGVHRDDRDRRGDPPLRPPLPAPRRARRADRAHLVLRPRRPRRTDHGHRPGRGHHAAPRAAATAAPPGPARPADRAAEPDPVPGAAAGAVRHARQPGRALLPRPGPVQGGQRPARARGRRRVAGRRWPTGCAASSPGTGTWWPGWAATSSWCWWRIRPPGELARLAEQILAALDDPIDVGDHHLSISASIGIVESDVASTTPANLVKSADVTLYWAKSDGRGRWATFDAERNARDMTSYTVLATLGQGVERDEFHVVYQPIVDLADQRVLGVEALVRWEHPLLGYLTPDQFIGHAEDSGLIVALGRAVLTQACTEIAAWNAAPPGPAAVRQREPGRCGRPPSPPWSTTSPRCSSAAGLPPELLQLEVTESDLLGPAGRPVDAISSLAAMGIRMALDDFGSGYSNLGYLPRLPLHTLKIAGILVEGLRERTAGAVPVVANLVQLAHELGLHVTAESVETGDQAAQLRGLRLRLGPGLALREGRPAERPDLPAGGDLP